MSIFAFVKYLLSIISICFTLLSVEAQEAPIRRILFEEFTGAWCGWCPRGNLILERILLENPTVIPVAIHSGPGFDPMRTDFGDRLTEDMLVWYPTAAIDRLRQESDPVAQVPDSEWANRVAQRLQEPAKAILMLEKSFDPITGQLDLEVQAEFLAEAKGDFRFNGYVVEDLVTGDANYNQTNYFNENQSYPELYGRGNPITDYVHRHVLREMLGGPYGINPSDSNHIPEQVRAGEQYRYQFTTRLKSTYQFEHIQLVAWLLKFDGPQNSEVLNAVSMPLLETGMGSLQAKPPFKAFPNPTNGVLHLQFDLTLIDRLKISVRKPTMEVVLEKHFEGLANQPFVEFNLSALDSGLYFLEISDGRQKRVQKVILLK